MEHIQNTIHLGPVGFLRTILWIVAIYYISKFLFKWWLKRKIENHSQQMQNSMDEQQAAQAQQEQGKVRIKQAKQNEKSAGNSGEYVDFEEVK